MARRVLRRRRRRHFETYTVRQCGHCVNVWQPIPCSNPLIDIFQLMGMNMTKGLGDTTEVASGGDRAVIVDGISFQAEHKHDPNKTIGGIASCDDVQPFDAAFFLTIWEAIIVLPYAQGSQVPAYLPNLSGVTGGQQSDLADRVLWKRIVELPIWGVNINGGIFPFPQLTATIRDTAAGPQRVKARARLDDRHGLYYVRNFTHDMFLDCDWTNIDLCGGGLFHGSLPIELDALFKVFYHTRK